MNSSPNTAMLACGGAGTSSASSTATAASSGALQLTGMPNTYTMPDHIQPLQQLVASLKSEPGQDAVGAAPHNHVQPDTAYGYAGAYPGAAYLAGANAYALYNNPLQMQMWQAHAYASHYNLGIGNQKKGRQTYRPYQVHALESMYRESQYVSKQKRAELMRRTGLDDRQIKIWFQNRRMKEKKEKQQKAADVEKGTPVPPNPPRNGNPSGSMPSNSATRTQRKAVSTDGESGRSGVSVNQPVELTNFANQAAIPPELSLQYPYPYVYPQTAQYAYPGISYYANS